MELKSEITKEFFIAGDSQIETWVMKARKFKY